jgi:iron complex outermembrane receptor protein
VRLGISHRYDIFSALSNTTSAFATGYQLDQPFAVGLSDTLALNVGGRTEFDFRVGGPSLRLDVIAGSEVERSISFRKSYGLVNSVVGGIRGDLQVISTQSNTFAQANLGLPLEITATAGASLNIVRYAITDRLANSANPTHLNQSGTLTFDPVVTPRFALQKAFGPDVSVYAQVSQGYSAPGSGSVVIPQIGQVNRDLRPERGTLYEIGSKASLFGGRLGYEVALFDLHVSDKLTSQAVTASNGSVLYTITTNAGNQKDRGVELALRYAFVRDEGAPLSLLQAFVSYTYSHFRYDGFKSDANNNAATIDYTGRKVVGVPDHVVAAGIDVGSGVGLYGNATLQYNGREPLTYDNAHFAPDYTLVSAKAGYRRDLPAGFRLDAFAGVRNIFDATWYSMVFLNSSYAGPPPNVYLPGFGTTFYGGFSVSKAL